mgnify:CR=1 FL=1
MSQCAGQGSPIRRAGLPNLLPGSVSRGPALCCMTCILHPASARTVPSTDRYPSPHDVRSDILSVASPCAASFTQAWSAWMARFWLHLLWSGQPEWPILQPLACGCGSHGWLHLVVLAHRLVINSIVSKPCALGRCDTATWSPCAPQRWAHQQRECQQPRASRQSPLPEQ